MKRRSLREAESYGWVVEDWDGHEAYEFACDRLGKEYVDDAIVDTLAEEEIASSLAYLFRMWDFREWESYKNGEDVDDDYDDDADEYEESLSRQFAKRRVRESLKRKRIGRRNKFLR
jgi:hypothetical protein